MPIAYDIDDARRLVVARGIGVFTAADMFTYQREVWSRPEVAGYDELVDMSEVEEIATTPTTGSNAQHLASMAAAMDHSANATKLAIVAPDQLAFGLGRMYQIYRGLEPRSTKQVRVFRTLLEALSFLGIDNLET